MFLCFLFLLVLLCSHVLFPMSSFIADDMDVPSAAQQPAVPQPVVPQPFVPPPQQPSYAPIVPQAPQMHSEKRTVEIEIPHGVKAGNQITVNLPNGKTVKVTVPNGMHAGNKLTINCKLPVLYLAGRTQHFLTFFILC